MNWKSLLCLIALWLTLSASSHSAEFLYPDTNDSSKNGKRLWLENCESCHGYGIAGAPIPMRATHWAGRVKKPREELYLHAINGFYGPGDTYMPARGGNDSLTDKEVKQAVDYMVALAVHFLTQDENLKEPIR